MLFLLVIFPFLHLSISLSLHLPINLSQRYIVKLLRISIKYQSYQNLLMLFLLVIFRLSHLPYSLSLNLPINLLQRYIVKLLRISIKHQSCQNLLQHHRCPINISFRCFPPQSQTNTSNRSLFCIPHCQ